MVKLVVRDRESIQAAVRRLRKLIERSGIKKEMRRREYYEKPSEIRRRARLRAERRARRGRLTPGLQSRTAFPGRRVALTAWGRLSYLCVAGICFAPGLRWS